MRPQSTVVAHVLNSLEGGGTERHLVALLQAMDGGPLRHVVITLRAAGNLAGRLPHSVACRALGLPQGGRAAWRPLAGALRESGASIVHARNIGTWFDATAAATLCPGMRLVLGFHGFDSGSCMTPRQRRKARIGLLAGARFTAVGHAARHQLCIEADLPLDRVDVLANGVDTRRFRPLRPTRVQEIRAALGIGHDTFVVGSVGSLTPVKRFDLLLDAAAHLWACGMNIAVLIAGEGPQRAMLADRAASCGMDGRLRLVGERDDVPDLLAAMDVYVCCSESEGSSNAVLEAMACARPLVVFDVGENTRLIRDGVDGVVVGEPAAHSLGSALARLHSDTGFTAGLGTSARTRTEQMSLERAARVYEDYYLAHCASGRCVDHHDEPVSYEPAAVPVETG